MAQIGFDFCVHSIMAWACTRALTTFVKYHDSFVFILLYIHDSSLSTWHDFIWTLDIRMIYLSVFLEEQGHFLCKSYFLSPVDSEYIHYFMHVAAKIFCLTGYWFILCNVAAFYSRHWMLHDILCNILDICFMLISFDNVAIFFMCLLKKCKRFCAICLCERMGINM